LQRAAAFPEIIPERPAFVYAPDQEPVHNTIESVTYGRHDIETGPRTSLLGRHFGAQIDDEAVFDEEDEETRPGGPRHSDSHDKFFNNELSRVISPSGSSRSNSIFEVPPHLSAMPLVGSFSSQRTYGTLGTDVGRPSRTIAAEMWQQQQVASMELPDGQRPTIMVREVEQEDGKFVLSVAGQSTLPQTIMNSTK
jgi:solute carrier family 32 (vesicular inhibitory amino acid transporter)